MSEPTKPTREQILAEPAGRHLDALVSEHVMGVPCLSQQDIGDVRYWHERTDGGRTWTKRNRFPEAICKAALLATLAKGEDKA